MKYSRYFDINPEYFPQVNEAVIRSNPDLWKSFYPHETFIKLMKDTIAVLTRRQKVSLWVEGAYGTGKSYAVLTMQKLLDASDNEVEEYFQKYRDQLSNDLKNQFLQAKRSGQILTVHRYGSANIHGDGRLAIAIQESIMAALAQKGLSSQAAESSLKNATLRWLQNGANKLYFNALMKGDYVDTFTGDDVEDLIDKLETHTGSALESLIGKISKVGLERSIQFMNLEIVDLVAWIKAIIEENNLKAIVFIWDEFTEYFRSNMRSLTGFQEVVEISATDPFYLMLVTHNVQHEFPEGSQDWRKISDRFHQPFCEITLPENIAFRLLGSAMEKTKDPVALEEWQDIVTELYNQTHDSRKLVQKKAGISDKELKDILPIQPYAALLLKHISSAFASNQRSMFDFIKNDRGDEIKGFQWFIHHRGPYDDGNPLLTIDMLWDFFYERGRNHLAYDIQNILDTFPRVERQLDRDQQRVLKTVLMLQAISQRAGDSVELFIPNEKNVDLAFEGSDLGNMHASRLADTIVALNILYKDTSGGRNQYSALINAADTAEIERLKEVQRQKSTALLLQEAEMDDVFSLAGPLRLRYETTLVTANNFRLKVNQLRGSAEDGSNKIQAVFSLAKNDAESVDLGLKINEAVGNAANKMAFVDASPTPMGHNLFEQYVDAMANAAYQSGRDNTLAGQYNATAKDVLRKWRNQVANGEFIIYTTEKPEGRRLHTMDEVNEYLSAINRRRFPNGLETMGNVVDGMWQSNNLPTGVQYGATESVAGQFRSSNPQTKLEKFIGEDAWKKPRYWEHHPYLPISQLKIAVEKVINNAFEEAGRVSVAEIYQSLQQAPYGLIPCNLTAFVMGFLLKEYANDNFSYSDGVTNDVLSIDKLKDMVSDILKHHLTPIPRYKDKFIVTMTPEEKAFNDASAELFGIPRNLCSSIEQTRGQIRNKMRDLSFPIWTLKYVLDEANLRSKKHIVAELINGFSGIANSQNTGSTKTDNDISQEIGRLLLSHKGLIEDLKPLVNREHCTKGMQKYLRTFEDGALVELSEEVGDQGQYINQVRSKFNTDAANWVWNLETAQQKISEVIVEYRIIAASNKVLGKSVSFDEAVREWINACRSIRISYLFARNHWEELSPLMELLYHMKRNGVLQDAQKQKFLEQITHYGDAFRRFYTNQETIFAKACEHLLHGIPHESYRDIYRLLPVDVFTAEKADYQAKVEDAIKEYREQQDALRLQELWRQKAGNEKPREWSRTYRMPILALVPEREQIKAREAFEALHRSRPERELIKRAIEYLEHADFFKDMTDSDKRDQAFVKHVIKDLHVMLDDVEAVKDYLFNAGLSVPYEWYQSGEVERRLTQMAEVKYNREGSKKALQIIDSMETQDVKRYLKQLIRDNMTVGMAIIKENEE
ncbi:MAG: hypothetical protein ACOX63_02545 [Christensenellales bacterium]